MVSSVDAAQSRNASSGWGPTGLAPMMVCHRPNPTPVVGCLNDAGSRCAIGAARVTFEAGIFSEMNSLLGYRSRRRPVRAAGAAKKCRKNRSKEG